MKLAIFGRLTEKTDLKILMDFFAFLHSQAIDFTIYAPYAQQLSQHFPSEFSQDSASTFHSIADLHNCRFLYCFGGDGTMLEAVRFIGNLKIPILGVNFGRLGYLASVTQQDLIPATMELQRGMFKVDTRSLLTVVSDPVGLFGNKPFGINDLTIHKSRTNEMITVHTYLNGEFLNSYWGDGVLVATPTGSTAYSLSCGGPIMFPSSSTFVITPIAPHSLTVRPVIIPDDWVVSFEIESRSGEAMIALDNRSKLVDTHQAIAIRKADFQVRLVRTSATKYIDNLRRSLMWGRDHRN
ncbi:MAG: NAD kinase [Bacteroidota bacterium]